MISRWKWFLVGLARKLWVRATLYAMFGLFTALLAWLAQPYVPSELSSSFGANAVDAVLEILAASMLAATTFALGIMVAALANAAGNATPRATALLMRDSTTQNVLATFLGSFLFSLTGIIALKAGIYGEGGRLILFLATLAMVAIIVLTMLRWIAHLSDFGRLLDTIDRVERVAAAAIAARLATPYLGGRPYRGALPNSARPIRPGGTGYVQYLDSADLSELAETEAMEIHVAALPGAFVHEAAVLAWVVGAHGDEAQFERLTRRINSAFRIGVARQFDQDPRFALAVMAEIALRALPPAANDPGTVIDVIGRGLRLLTPWARAAPMKVLYPRLWVPEIKVADLFDDFFRPIARDGAAHIEIQIRLQKALLALAEIDRGVFGAAALHHSAEALARARKALDVEADLAHLERLHQAVTRACSVAKAR